MKKGTSLVEVMVYMACCGLMCCCVGHLILSMQKAGQERIQLMDTSISLALALTVFLDDLKKAPAHILKWKRRNDDCMVYSTATQDCGWLVDKRRLIRVTGCYNAENGIWSGRATSVVLDCVDLLLLEWQFQSSTVLAGVRVTIATKKVKKTLELQGFASFNKEAQ